MIKVGETVFSSVANVTVLGVEQQCGSPGYCSSLTSSYSSVSFVGLEEPSHCSCQGPVR